MANRILISSGEDIPVPEWLDKAEAFVNKVMDLQKWNGEEISIYFCSDSQMQVLNKEYRDIDAPTDVLSFEDGTEFTEEDGSKWISGGDIIISLETLPKNAEYFEVDQDEELRRLVVHGLLHIHGMDHGEEHVEKGKEPECEMLKVQKQIMETLKDEKIIG